MNKEKLNEVLEILSKYNSGQSVVNYYELFGLNKNMSIEELKTQIKQRRLQVLFHPDQIKFIPEEYHSKYLEMIEVVKNVIDTFDDYRKKDVYDEELEESFRHNRSNNYNNSSNNQSYNYQENNSYDEEKAEDLAEVELGQAIIINSRKYGFEFTRNALVDLVKTGSVNKFTRDHNTREMIANIDRDKIVEILHTSSINDDLKDIEELVMNYMTDFVYKMPKLREQVNYIEQACVATLEKYDLNGSYGQTNYALNTFCESGYAEKFTRNNGVRDKLRNNVNHKNANFFAMSLT